MKVIWLVIWFRVWVQSVGVLSILDACVKFFCYSSHRMKEGRNCKGTVTGALNVWRIQTSEWCMRMLGMHQSCTITCSKSIGYKMCCVRDTIRNRMYMLQISAVKCKLSIRLADELGY